MTGFDTETLITRNDSPRASFSLMDEMFISRGTKADWDLLHDLHYKAENLPIGPRFWKLELHGETIGVIVTGTPKGMLRERHQVFPKMKPGSGDSYASNKHRYVHINAHFRVISRFVLDTMFRGIGAGYRMMNLVSRMEGNTYMEIQSSMSKFNYFGQKAGFSFVKPANANNYDRVMKFFRSTFNSSPQDFEALVNETLSMSAEHQNEMRERLLSFYFRFSALENTSFSGAFADARAANMTIRDLIKGIQQIGLASPMYGIWKSPDIGTVIPAVLPLTAFDRQLPNERLVLL